MSHRAEQQLRRDIPDRSPGRRARCGAPERRLSGSSRGTVGMRTAPRRCRRPLGQSQIARWVAWSKKWRFSTVTAMSIVSPTRARDRGWKRPTAFGPAVARVSLAASGSPESTVTASSVKCTISSAPSDSSSVTGAVNLRPPVGSSDHRRVFEVFGTNAEHDRTPVVPSQRRPGGERFGGERQLLRADLNRSCVARDGQHGVVQVHRWRPDERRDEHVRRVVVQILRCVDLLEIAVLQDGDPVAHRHCLDLIVGDVDGRHPQAALQRGDLGPHLDTQLGIQVRQWFVHQEHGRLTDDGTPHCHPLTLAA